MVAEGYGDQRGKMEYDVYAFHSLPDSVGVADVARENLDVFKLIFREAFQPAPGVEGVVENESPDRGAFLQEGFDKVRSDEAFGAGDKGFSAFKFHKKAASASLLGVV